MPVPAQDTGNGAVSQEGNWATQNPYSKARHCACLLDGTLSGRPKRGRGEGGRAEVGEQKDRRKGQATTAAWVEGYRGHGRPP